VQLNTSDQRASDLIEESIASMQSLGDELGVHITAKPHDADLRVSADPDKVVQTLTNLVGNAIKFSERGSSVVISVHAQDAGAAVFAVRDCGRGIPGEHLDRIFDRFAQVDPADTRTYGGTGLGLAICKQIVEQHGGHIWVASEVDSGSTFSFTIPLSKATGLATPAPSLVGSGREITSDRMDAA